MSKKVYTFNEICGTVTPILQKYAIARAWLFGSYARNEATAESDVDILIEGFTGEGLTAFGHLYIDISESLGKNVDLVNVEDLRRDVGNPITQRFIHRIKKDRVSLYDKN